MTGVLSETTCSLAKIAAMSPSNRAARSHRATVFRWVTKGVNVNGTLVKLEAARVGGHWVTSIEAYERFVTRCGQHSASPAEAVPTPAQVRRENERLDREIDALMKLK